jgi:hypothetical protein
MSLRLGMVRSLGVAAAVASAGCGGATAVCNGACITAGAVIDQTTLTSSIVSLTADPPCTVSELPLDGGTEVVIGVNQGPAGSAGSCQITETLADGSTWVATLSWEPVGGSGCCATATHDVGPAPTFTRVDGGTP